MRKRGEKKKQNVSYIKKVSIKSKGTHDQKIFLKLRSKKIFRNYIHSEEEQKEKILHKNKILNYRNS